MECIIIPDYFRRKRINFDLKKVLVQKLYKNPEAFLYEAHFYAYLQELESTHQLSLLPRNLYVYYVLSMLFAEVNNGGFLQFLQNSSSETFDDLLPCARFFGISSLEKLIEAFTDSVNKYLAKSGQSLSCFDPDNQTIEILDKYDNEFYDLESKIDLERELLRYYKNNFTVKSIKYPAAKEKTSDVCNYFIVPIELLNNDLFCALDSFLKVLADFSEQNWTIELWNFFDTYRICAHTSGKAICLETVMSKWSCNGFSFSSNNDDCYRNRMRLCSFFDTVSIVSGIDGNSEYAVTISQSGFEQNEKIMKYRFILSGIRYELAFSKISVGDMSHKQDPEKYHIIKEYLENHFGDYDNINAFFESGEYAE